MPGPAPKPEGARRRRNVAPGVVRLPAEGRTGEAPPWPLEQRSEREATLWTELWKLPQAVAWERHRWPHDVAMYCRWSARAEAGTLSSVAASREARMLSDRLGLTPMAMLKLRWEIVEAEIEPAAAAPRPRRLRAVEPEAPGAVAGP